MAVKKQRDQVEFRAVGITTHTISGSKCTPQSLDKSQHDSPIRGLPPPNRKKLTELIEEQGIYPVAEIKKSLVELRNEYEKHYEKLTWRDRMDFFKLNQSINLQMMAYMYSKAATLQENKQSKVEVNYNEMLKQLEDKQPDKAKAMLDAVDKQISMISKTGKDND